MLEFDFLFAKLSPVLAINILYTLTLGVLHSLKYSGLRIFSCSILCVRFMCVAALQTTAHGALLMLFMCCVPGHVMVHRGAVTSVTLLCRRGFCLSYRSMSFSRTWPCLFFIYLTKQCVSMSQLRYTLTTKKKEN